VIVAAIILTIAAIGERARPAPNRPEPASRRFVTGPGKAVVDGPTHQGVEVTIDLPESQHVRNRGGSKDGVGLCVFASMDMAARWSNYEKLIGIIAKIERGGGWPEKVDQVIKEHAPDLKYVQVDGTADMALLDQAMKSRRAACVTYGYGERYGGQTISHMVLLVHLDDEWACIVDNNFPGTYEWMSRDEFKRRWVHPSGKGWAFVLLSPPPPPVPSN
jgi:hypothetical protein